MRVGVLALQGDYAAHAAALAEADPSVAVTKVKTRRDLAGLAGLAIPGGESTTLLKLLPDAGLDDGIPAFVREGGAVFGTCAGAILLARRVTRPEQPSLGLLDASVERNSYGRQIDSFIGEAAVDAAARGGLGAAPLPAVFIRAPRFTELGGGVEILARRGEDPVLVREGRVLAATFHPELAADRRVHALFLAACRSTRTTAAGVAE